MSLAFIFKLLFILKTFSFSHMNIIEAKMSRFNVDSSRSVDTSTLVNLNISDMLPITPLTNDDVDEFSR